MEKVCALVGGSRALKNKMFMTTLAILVMLIVVLILVVVVMLLVIVTSDYLHL